MGNLTGFDAALFMANLFLFTYESKWVLRTKKGNIQRAIKFALSFRLVDDLCAINNNSEFEKKSKKIHPPESVLKKQIPEN